MPSPHGLEHVVDGSVRRRFPVDLSEPVRPVAIVCYCTHHVAWSGFLLKRDNHRDSNMFDGFHGQVHGFDRFGAKPYA